MEMIDALPDRHTHADLQLLIRTLRVAAMNLVEEITDES